MKGDPKVIDLLNEILTGELTAINQYFLHAKMCQNWGYDRLYKSLWDESIGEMKHADEIIGRIIFLEGVPNISAYDKILVGSDVKQQLENDLSLESAALTVLHPVARVVHGHQFLGRRRMHGHGAVEIVLGAAGLQRDAQQLRHFAGFVTEDMSADDLAIGRIDD